MMIFLPIENVGRKIIRKILSKLYNILLKDSCNIEIKLNLICILNGPPILPANKYDWVPGTSNLAERLFSHARFTLTDYRNETLPINFESVVFLYTNKQHWDVCLVNECFSAQ